MCRTGASARLEAVTTPLDARRFTALPLSECLDRLATATIGRVVWNTVDGPRVLPVTFALYRNQIVFRTSPYGPLAELQTPRAVAFEVDEFDRDTRSGWSVVAQGRSAGARRPDELVELWREADPVPWAAGSRTMFISITTHAVTGRRVLADPGGPDDG